MSRLVRSKREWRCNKCDATQIVWEGKCRACGSTNTLQEVQLLPSKDKPRGTTEARRLRRRAKDSERNIAKRMVAADGADENYRNIASSSGRVGFITGMRFDAVSKTYIIENKNRKIPTWMSVAWILLTQRGYDLNKNILLHVEPPNIAREVLVNGMKHKVDTMAIIPQGRHEELIRTEHAFKLAAEILMDLSADEETYKQVWDTLNGRIIGDKNDEVK